MATSLKKILIIYVLLIFIGVFQNSKEKCFFDFDPFILNNTQKLVKKKVRQSELLEKKAINKILCEYVAHFDTLNFLTDFDEESLKNHITIVMDSLVINYASTYYYYDCYCDVYDTVSKKIASIDSYQNFYVFPKFPGKFFIQDYLSVRYVDLNDQFVFRPASKRHTFNYDWHLAISKDCKIVWFNINEPQINYTTEQIRENHLGEVLIN